MHIVTSREKLYREIEVMAVFNSISTMKQSFWLKMLLEGWGKGTSIKGYVLINQNNNMIKNLKWQFVLDFFPT